MTSMAFVAENVSLDHSPKRAMSSQFIRFDLSVCFPKGDAAFREESVSFCREKVMSAFLPRNLLHVSRKLLISRLILSTSFGKYQAKLRCKLISPKSNLEIPTSVPTLVGISKQGHQRGQM